MKLNCVNDVLSWFDDACKNSSYGLVVGDDGKFRTRAYFVNMQFVLGVSTGSLLVRYKREHAKLVRRVPALLVQIEAQSLLDPKC